MDTIGLRFRQVHLDFHTSAACEDVGADFDPQVFAETVKMGHVNSMTLFAKCHHGFSYYPTRVGTTHPHLTRDLLGQQIEALHSVKVQAPIYLSLMWDDLAGELHPEWIIVEKDGTLCKRSPLSNQSPLAGGKGWTTLDLNSGYGEYVITQVEEICQNYEVDGFFFDICHSIPNYAPWNLAHMREAGVEPENDQAVLEFTKQALARYLQRLSDVVRERVPNATLFFNGTVSPAMAPLVSLHSHLEVESLPTSSHLWGYLHYPLMARQVRTYGMDFLGMTGRFHKSWADFGGLKTRDQLDYECGTIVGAGGKISVGDQLHPRGVLDPAVYRLLGHSLGKIEQLEPWLIGTRPTAEIGILNLGRPTMMKNLPLPAHSNEVEGAAQLFLEAAIQFDIIDSTLPSFSRYKALVLPDGSVVDTTLRDKLHAFIADGGKLIVSGTAALDADDNTFLIDHMPITYLAPTPTVPSYLRPDEALARESELARDYDYVFYEQAHLVRPADGTKTYGRLRQALFNRTWEHFTSHAHAPVGACLDAPIAVANTQILYFAAPLFAAYREHDYWAYRVMALNVLRDFLPPPLLRASGPGWAECTLHTQASSDEHGERMIVHVVIYQPRRTLQSIQHVDQSWKTTELSLKVLSEGRTPERVYLAPEQHPLDFVREGDSIQIDLPPVGPHTTVVLEF